MTPDACVHSETSLLEMFELGDIVCDPEFEIRLTGEEHDARPDGSESGREGTIE